MSRSPLLVVTVLLCLRLVSSQWLAIDGSSVRTWNEETANRSRTLTTFQVTNYPSKYVRGLENRIDTYTYDRANRTLYFIMEQTLYGISKFFKYNSSSNQVDQTQLVQSFMIDYIQYNSVTNRLYAIVHDNTNGQDLVEVDANTLEVKRYIIRLIDTGSSMPGSYFDPIRQRFTYHAYNFAKDHTVLNTLDLSDNSSRVVIESKFFDFNVYGFGYVSSVSLLALWQYSIITPIVCIQIDEQTGSALRNITVTPTNVRIIQGYKPFYTDTENRLFYVLSWASNLSATYISKIYMDALQVDIKVIHGQSRADYLFFRLG